MVRNKVSLSISVLSYPSELVYRNDHKAPKTDPSKPMKVTPYPSTGPMGLTHRKAVGLLRHPHWGPKAEDLLDRFIQSAKFAPECRIWTGKHDCGRYPIMNIGPFQRYGIHVRHVYWFSEYQQPLRPEYRLFQGCTTPHCLEHLFAGPSSWTRLWVSLQTIYLSRFPGIVGLYNLTRLGYWVLTLPEFYQHIQDPETYSKYELTDPHLSQPEWGFLRSVDAIREGRVDPFNDIPDFSGAEAKEPHEKFVVFGKQ